MGPLNFATEGILIDECVFSFVNLLFGSFGAFGSSLCILLVFLGSFVVFPVHSGAYENWIGQVKVVFTGFDAGDFHLVLYLI